MQKTGTHHELFHMHMPGQRMKPQNGENKEKQLEVKKIAALIKVMHNNKQLGYIRKVPLSVQVRHLNFQEGTSL